MADYPIPLSAASIEAALLKVHNDQITKSEVGLGNVDNTSDANKPVSTAQAAAIAAAEQNAKDYADGLSALATYKNGNIVILNPANLGAYANAQAAIADVPTGGTLFIVGDYDVSVHGPIVLTRGIKIIGAGWGKTDASGSEISSRLGTRIINNSGTPAATCISCSSSLFNDGTYIYRMQNLIIKDLMILHRGSGAAINIKDSVYGSIENVYIDLNHIGAGGIHYENTITNPQTGACFYQYIKNTRVFNFAEYGVWFENSLGSLNVIEDCTIRSYNVVSQTAAVILSTKDTHILRSQVGCPNGAPGILIRATAAYGRPPIGITIEKVLIEDGATLVKTESDGSYFIEDLRMKDCANGFFTPGTKFFDLEYCKNARLEGFRRYGSYADSQLTNGTIGNFGDNSSNNLVLLNDTQALFGVTDTGTNNVIIVENISDRNFVKLQADSIIQNAKNVIAKQVESAHHLEFYKNGLSWAPKYPALKTIEDITGCVFHFDARDLSSLWQDDSRTSNVSADGQSVFIIDDTNYGSRPLSFTRKEKLLSVVVGATTSLSAYAGEFTSVRPGDVVAVGGVIVNSGPDINGSHVVNSKTSDQVFVIDFDSTGGSYDLTNAYYINESNVPVYEADCLGKGVPGVFFEGSVSHLRGPIISLGGKDASFLCVYSSTAAFDDGALRCVIGRYYSYDALFIDNINSNGTHRHAAAFQNDINYTSTTWVNTSPVGPVFLCATSDGVDIDIEYAFKSSLQSGNDTAFNREDKIWMIGARGSLPSSELGLFKGYIHSIAIFNRKLTKEEVKSIQLEQSLAFNCISEVVT